MAEDEIIKHTKAAYKAWKNPDKNWKHKLREILIEILIIVFAVSISIWLHNWSDSLQDRKEEKTFLTGLKEDLAADAADLDSNLAYYNNQMRGLTYFARIGRGDSLQTDSLFLYNTVFFSSTEFDPQISRYEALKGSGKFRIIENEKLLDTIIHLHEETLIHIESLGKIYYDFYNNRLFPFFSAHLQLDPQGRITNAKEILKDPQMRLFIAYEKALISNNIIVYYPQAVDECNGIIKEIDEELKK